jgi:hypothetical protein
MLERSDGKETKEIGPIRKSLFEEIREEETVLITEIRIPRTTRIISQAN